jgi:hypothetical protein
MFKFRKTGRAAHQHKQYVRISSNAYEMYPGDVIAQANYVAANGTKADLLMHLLYAAQRQMHTQAATLDQPRLLSASHVDFLLCGFIEAVRHIEADVCQSVLSNVETTLRLLADSK